MKITMGFIFELPIGNIESNKTTDILPGFDNDSLWSNVTDETNKDIISIAWNNTFVYVTDTNIVTTTIANMMVYFTSSEKSTKYPESSPYLCHNCCHSFKSIPCFIPIKIEINDDGHTIQVRGNFCSFNCALTEIINFPKKYNHDSIELLRFMYRLIVPNKEELIPAQPKEVIKSFGGVLSIEEYRKLFFELSTTMDIVFPPIVTIIPILEKTEITSAPRNLITKQKKKLVQTTIYGS